MPKLYPLHTIPTVYKTYLTIQNGKIVSHLSKSKAEKYALKHATRDNPIFVYEPSKLAY